jgi:hypothetical protein
VEKIEDIIRSALHEAAFIGYDEDDEMSQEGFVELVEDTTEKIKEVLKK